MLHEQSMCDAVTVRAFEAHEWEIYRDLRLRALADAPDAFASTLAGETRLSDSEWARRLATSTGSAPQISAVAESGDRPVGIAYGRIESGDSDAAHLYAMWVDPTARRSGVGRALLRAVVSWARSAPARRRRVEVTQGNVAAVRLYPPRSRTISRRFAPARRCSCRECGSTFDRGGIR